MPSGKKGVTLKENASSILKESMSQTDASEWVEYETDMKDLYEILKEEGIDVPVDEKGVPILTPQFIKSLPPSIQPHAAGKLYSGGKPFKSTINEPAPKRFLGRLIQTRTSIWEDYKKELNELYSILEKNGVSVPRDEDGVPIYNEELVKSLPPEQVPHPAGKEFTPIAGMPPLADGTRVSPRLTLRLLTPALTKELLKRCNKKGIEVPMQDGKPNITSDFLLSIPPSLLQDVLQPLYENQARLSEKRESVLSKLSLEKKNSLKNMLEQKGIEVKSTERGEPIIPMITIMQFTEEEVSQVVGEDDSHDIFKPAPQRAGSIPDDALLNLSKERRDSIGAVLHEQGLSVDVDENDVPIITKTHVHFLPQDALEELQIADEDFSKPSEADIRKSTEHGDDNHKARHSKEENEHHSHKKTRKHISFRTGRGLFNLTRQSVKSQLAKRLEAAGIEIKMTSEGELELSNVPDEIVAEFTSTIQDELREIDAQEMHHRINAMMDDEKELIHEHFEVAGIDLPVDETGNKVITIEFLEKLPRDVLINLLAKLFTNPRTSVVDASGDVEEGDDEDEHLTHSASGRADTGSDHDDDFELELTDDQKEDFYDRLLEEGIRAPLDEVTGKPRFTREFVRNIPKKLAREIITAAAVNAEDQARRLSSSEDSDEEEEDGINYRMSKDENFMVHEEKLILGLRHSPEGLSYVADDKGQRVKYEKIVECLKNAYSDSELRKHDEIMREKEADLRAAIREERRHEEKDHELKRAGSDVEMQQMAMRFIPEYNPRPRKSDPINLFEHIRKPRIENANVQGIQKGVEFVHIMEPSFMLRKADSLATVPSTVARKFSNDSVRGSALSTVLSDMPSMFSQGLGEDPSAAYMITPSTQQFDITAQSVSDYREKWLTSFMSGYTPKQTFTICIINMITRKQVELRVCRENTLNEVCHLYMQYENHPEYYVWKDIYGRLLVPEKTLVENGLMRQDEVLEFQGYRRLPVILLYFRDGFESDPPLPLNPLHALKQREPGLCRNY